MERFIASLIVVCLAMLLAISTAAAAIVSTTGQLKVIDPPASVAVDGLESDLDIHVFAEQTNFQLPTDSNVDYIAPSSYPATYDASNPPAAIQPSIAAGTWVNSYYIHADQQDKVTSKLFKGTVTFAQPILGVMVKGTTLLAANNLLGAVGTTYPAGGGGLELGGCADNAIQDCVKVTGPSTLEVKFINWNVTDSLRVITQAPPARTIMGFYQPVEMNSALNTMKGGATVPMKFEVFEGQTEITDVDQVVISVESISCPNNADQAPVEETTMDVTNLRYDVDGGQFIYTWKTPKTPGSCYRVMASSGNASIVANFLLK